MLATVPARFASRSWAVVTSLAFKPGKLVLLMFGTCTTPTPRLTLGRVVCVPPLLLDCEYSRVISKPPWKACAPWFQLRLSANWIIGLYVKRGDATFICAYCPLAPKR